MAEALVKAGQHKVTAISREGSQSKLPKGVHVQHVNYNEPSTIVKALRGQDCLIVTMAVSAPQDQQTKLLDSAIEAGVRWILPNEWGIDADKEDLLNDVLRGGKSAAARDHILKSNGSFIGVCTGFWYEWSLCFPAAYGFDLINRRVTFYDDGNTKISTSTWQQVGRAVTSLLSLPEHAEDGKGLGLDQYRNQLLFINSFVVSQREIFESALRVTGTKAEDWEISYQPSEERYQQGKEKLFAGDRTAFAQVLYSRVLYKDGSGNLTLDHTMANEALGLTKEDLDQATKRALERVQELGPNR